MPQTYVHKQKTNRLFVGSVCSKAQLSLVATIFITGSEAKQCMRTTDIDYRSHSHPAVSFLIRN